MSGQTSGPKIVRASDFPELEVDNGFDTERAREATSRKGDVRHAIKEVESPDSGTWVVEMRALTDGGGSIDFWRPVSEVDLEPLSGTRTVTTDGERYSKPHEVNAMDGDTIATLFECIETFDDAMKVACANSVGEISYWVNQKGYEI